MKVFTKVICIVLCAMFAFSMAIPVFAESEDKVIHEVRLTIAQPEANGAPATEIISSEPNKYTVEIRYWLEQYNNSGDKVTVFEPGKSYGVVFFVYAVNGYKFEEVGKINGHDFNNSPSIVYANGKEAHCVGVESEARLYRAIDFSIPEETPEKPDGFFAKIRKSIKNFFSKIVNFFKGLFKF